ncbi:MAG: TraX family protein [Roseburia sp.]
MSGNTLKLIGVITMFIDHIGAGILYRLFFLRAENLQGGILGWLLEEGRLYRIYGLCRTIGRIAFPIFCFLLVEGFLYTRSRKKYALRLGVFVLLSEIPFDLLFENRVVDVQGQNIFFTLLIGFLVMCLCARLEERFEGNVVLRTGACVPVACVGMLLANVLHTDYGAKGVFCIMVLYVFRKNRLISIAASALSFVWWESAALLAFLPIALYNGKRGSQIKYFFYAFYPLHLLLLYMICLAAGIADLGMN